MKQSSKLKIELSTAIVSLVIASIVLISTTYAWYVANNRVSGTTTTISATTNGFVLQISTLERGAQHGGAQESLEAFSEGAVLSPASSDDMTNWYVCAGWDSAGRVTSYVTPSFASGENAKPGKYVVAGNDYYAFIRSDFVLYTIYQTGVADVYLDASEGAPITVTATSGDGVAAVTDSMRVAITTQALDDHGQPTGAETLRIVYAPENETGIGNDHDGINGWTAIKNVSGTLTPQTVTYPYIYGEHYTDQLQTGRNWVATLSANGKDYIVPDGSEAIAEAVGYDGILVHVYIWMEGTDADCVNGRSVEEDDSVYSVTVKFAGVAP